MIEVAMHWKPIAEDPPGGVALLVFHPKQAYCIAMFMAGPDVWWNIDGNFHLIGNPTHWMALEIPHGVKKEEK